MIYWLIFNFRLHYIKNTRLKKESSLKKRMGWITIKIQWNIQFSSVAQSCPTLHDPMNRSTPGLPVHCQLPEFTQTYVHWVGDAIQPSHPLSSPSPPAFSPSQHQGLFQWVSSSHQVAKIHDIKGQLKLENGFKKTNIAGDTKWFWNQHLIYFLQNSLPNRGNHSWHYRIPAA